MRCWVFHRGGAFGSEKFSINENPERFLSVVVSYATMSPADMGYDPTITTGGFTGRQVTVITQLYDLVPSPFIVTPAIASRGTTCTVAKLSGETKFNYVCKDAWRSHSYISEGVLLQEAQTAGVKGLVKYISHAGIHVGAALDDISGNIIKGLDITGVKALNLRLAETLSTAPTTPLEPQSIGPLRHSSIGAHETRKLPCPANIPLPRSSQMRQMTSLSSITLVSFNRVHTRLVTTKGRPITQFTSSLELLLTLRDAIKGHRSLLRHGILHRDISVNNIMITLGNRSDDFHSSLISLDLARRMDDPRAPPPHQHNGVHGHWRSVRGATHISSRPRVVLLRVFVSLYPLPTRRHRQDGLADSNGASAVRQELVPGCGSEEEGGIWFEMLVRHFTEEAVELVPLAWAIREVLFPWRGRLFTGTDPEAEAVYERVLKAIEEVVEGILR